MAEPINIQDLIDGRLDIQSLGEAANGDENTTVVTRTGETYPSAKRAIKQMFGSGGLPATPFTTKASMAASTLVDGDYAYVTDDIVADNNGLYQKTAGVWIKSKYEPVKQAQEIINAEIAEIKRNDISKSFDQSIFSESKKLSSTVGAPRPDSTGWKTTQPIPVVAGDVVEITTVITEANTAYLVVWQSGATTPEEIVKTTTGSPELRTWIYTITKNGTLYSQHAPNATGCKIVINKDKKRFLDESSLANSGVFNTKADKISAVRLNDFEMGYVDDDGNILESDSHARSVVYKLKAGETIEAVKTDSGLWWAYAVSSTPNPPPSQLPYSYPWFAGNGFKINITADKPYIRLYVRTANNTPLTIERVLAGVTFKSASEVVYKKDIAELISINASNDLLAQDYNTNFRSPSLATGGVVSFSDDDGQAQLYTDLYPFILENQVPFGIAIVTSRVDNPKQITTDQLLEMAANKKYIEVMSHSYSHIHNIAVTISDEEREIQVRKAKEWLNARGMEARGFVYPFGDDDANFRRIAQKHHTACYDYYGVERVETFDTIKNSQINRVAFTTRADRVPYIKGLVDQAIAQNGWLHICTHAGQYQWNATSYDDLKTIIDYIKLKGVRIMLPDDAFRIFGNIIESDNGFKIQANGKIVGAI